MRRLILSLITAAALALLALAAPAGARSHHRARALATCPAGAPEDAFTVVNEVSVPAGYLAKLERAIVAQSAQARAVWHSPCAAFVPSGGWPLYLTWKLMPMCVSPWVPGAGGCHQPGAINVEISDSGYHPSWTVQLSHELLESLVDPSTDRLDKVGGSPLEICDPVDSSSYRLGGVWVSDFTLPAFWRGAGGRWDEMGQL